MNEDTQSKDMSDDDVFMDIKHQADEYLELTEDGRALSERCRDYVDGNQWTEAEKAALAKRNQAPIVNNRIKTKLQGLLGLVAARRTDPKAFPRTKHEEKSAEAITDALRYVADKNDLNTIKQEVADNFFCEGVGAVIVDVKANAKGENEILIEDIHWDRFYYDPFSRKRDFSDARYQGTMTWMDEDQLLALFPDANLDLMLAGHSLYETFEDRPRWVDKRDKRRRFRVAMHFYLKKESWWMCIFTEGGFLKEPVESPYLNEDGEPTCPIEAVGAYIDRANQRYGELASSLDLQDEINHRRSKALHLLSQRQTKAAKGAIKDVAALKRELAKPDGHVEIQGEIKDFEVLQTSDMAQGQFELLQEAKAEIDAQSYNAQMSGDRQNGDLSGIAIRKLQEAGVNELNNLFSALNGWELRVYRQVWARVKQFWTEEKWVRVTDDQDSLRWVGLNSQITAQQWLEELINDTDQPTIKRKQASATYQALMQAAQGDNPQDAQAAQAQLDHPVDVRNRVPELDVDIILDQSFDTVNVEQEQFELLAQLAQNPNSGIDPIELIRVSKIRGKDEMIERIEKSREAGAQNNQVMQENQQLKLENSSKQQEHALKSQEIAANTDLKKAELDMKAQELEANNHLKGQEMGLKHRELSLKEKDTALQHMNSQQPAQQSTPKGPGKMNEQGMDIPALEQLIEKKKQDQAQAEADAQTQAAQVQAAEQQRLDERNQEMQLQQAAMQQNQLLAEHIIVAIGQLTAAIQAPKEVIRDSENRVMGVKTASMH